MRKLRFVELESMPRWERANFLFVKRWADFVFVIETDFFYFWDGFVYFHDPLANTVLVIDKRKVPKRYFEKKKGKGLK